jgi:hypothetical protein
MSAGMSKKTPDLDEDQANELMKEYTAKLVALRERADDLLQQWQDPKKMPLMPLAKPSVKLVDNGIQLLDLWKTMRPAALLLAQYVSQTIEHAKVDQITELELRLRLPEFEHNLRFLDEKIRAISKNFQAAIGSFPERISEIQRAIFIP